MLRPHVYATRGERAPVPKANATWVYLPSAHNQERTRKAARAVI
jgi:hypothetical protein